PDPALRRRERLPRPHEQHARDVRRPAADARPHAPHGLARREPLGSQAGEQPRVLPRGPGLAPHAAQMTRTAMLTAPAAPAAPRRPVRRPRAGPGPGVEPPAPRPAWIVKSDASAQVLLKVFARFLPEGAGQLGVPGLDEQVLDLQPLLYERTQAATKEALA